MHVYEVVKNKSQHKKFQSLCFLKVSDLKITIQQCVCVHMHIGQRTAFNLIFLGNSEDVSSHADRCPGDHRKSVYIYTSLLCIVFLLYNKIPSAKKFMRKEVLPAHNSGLLNVPEVWCHRW